MNYNYRVVLTKKCMYYNSRVVLTKKCMHYNSRVVLTKKCLNYNSRVLEGRSDVSISRKSTPTNQKIKRLSVQSLDAFAV